MWSIALRRPAVIASLAMAIGWHSIGLAATPASGASVVARLYKDFAWMAIAGQPDLFGRDLSHQPKSVLEKYFASELASLLIADAACQAKYQGICNLDFDLLFASQDPTVTDLEVRTLSPNKISVEFKNPVTEAKTKLEFWGAAVGGVWKITDIVYAGTDTSLKKILLRKIP